MPLVRTAATQVFADSTCYNSHFTVPVVLVLHGTLADEASHIVSHVTNFS